MVQISVTDFLRTISELSGLNILIDPEVGGSLTLNVEQVPWDQLFDAVLQSQGLAKRIEGNLIRISTQDKLRAEQEISQSLKEATFLAADTLTVTKRLNYAIGAEISGTLEPHLTLRGSMNVDDRTNTLIISDVPYGIDAVTSLLNILDVAEKQVEIEARIIEASTNFSRSLGVNLGIGIGRIDPPKNAFGDVADRVTSQINTITPASGELTGMSRADAGWVGGCFSPGRAHHSGRDRW